MKKKNQKIASGILITEFIILAFIFTMFLPYLNNKAEQVDDETTTTMAISSSWTQTTLWADPGGTNYRGMIVTDIENDGVAELIFCMDTYKMFIVNYSGVSYDKQDFTLPFGVSQDNIYMIDAVDYDEDGVKEIYLLGIEDNGTNYECQIWQGIRQDYSTWDWTKKFSINDTEIWYGRSQCYLGDCDNDGDLDIILSASLREEVTAQAYMYYLDYNKSTDNFDMKTIDSHSITTAKAGILGYSVGDIDNDGLNEVYCILYNNTDGTSRPRDSYLFQYMYNSTSADWEKNIVIQNVSGPEQYHYTNIEIGDIDNDNINELVYSAKREGALYYIEYNGTDFVNHTLIFTRASWYNNYADIHIMDLDNDGKNEIFCTQAQACCATSIDIINGSGTTWTVDTIYSSGENNVAYLSIYDLDRDGRYEIYRGEGWSGYKEFFKLTVSDIPTLPAPPIHFEHQMTYYLPVENGKAKLEWNPSYAENLQNYHLQVSDTYNFASLIVDNDTIPSTQTWYDFDKDSAELNKIYWFRVSAINGTGEGTFSTPYRFLIDAIAWDDWWDEDWRYRREIVINNTANPSTLNNYLKAMNIPYCEGMKDNFDDIRFADSDGNPLQYWIESYTPSFSADLWISISSIPASGNTSIFLYYGNYKAVSESEFLFNFYVNHTLNNSLSSYDCTRFMIEKPGTDQMHTIYHPSGNPADNYWNGANWVSDNTASVGIGSHSANSIKAYYYDDEWGDIIFISDWPGTFRNHIKTWDGDSWVDNATLENGLDLASKGEYLYATFFKIGNQKHLLLDYNKYKFTWNGTQWVANSSLPELPSGIGETTVLHYKFNQSGTIKYHWFPIVINPVNTSYTRVWQIVGNNWTEIYGGILGGFPDPVYSNPSFRPDTNVIENRLTLCQYSSPSVTFKYWSSNLYFADPEPSYEIGPEEEQDFEYWIEWNISISGSFVGMTTGDFNSDGVIDFAGNNMDGKTYVIDGKTGEYLWNKDHGYFSERRYDIVSTDLNNDGFDDIITYNENTKGLYAYNGSDGTILWSDMNSGDTTQRSPAIGDFDRDGVKDEVVSCAGWEDAYVRAFDGDGSILWTYSAGDYASSSYFIEVADINNDGFDDVYAGSSWPYNKAFVVNNSGDLLYEQTFGAIYKFTTGDIYGDENKEVIYESVARNATNHIVWQEILSSPLTTIASKDVTYNGKDDIILCTDDYICVIEGETFNVIWNKSIDFRTPGAWVYYYTDVIIEDINGDGKLELITVSDDGNLYILDGSTGKTIKKIYIGASVNYGCIEFFIDNEGWSNLLLGTITGDILLLDIYDEMLTRSSDFYIRFNMTWTNDLESSGIHQNKFLDLDGDGINELIHTTGGYNEMIYEWNGFDYNWIMNISHIIFDVGDYDGDGIEEVCSCNSSTSMIFYFFQVNLTTKTWTLEYTWNHGFSERGSMHFGDLEHDGKKEMSFYTADGERRIFSFNGTDFEQNASFDFIDWGYSPDCVLVDLDGDNRDEIVTGFGYETARNGDIYIYEDYLGGYNYITHFDFSRDAGIMNNDNHEDLTGDGRIDLIVGSAVTGVDNYRHIIHYNATSKQYEVFPQLSKQVTNYVLGWGSGRIAATDDLPRYVSFFCPGTGSGEYWTDRLNCYIYNGSTFNPSIVINMGQTITTYLRYNVEVRDINGDGFDEIIWDGKNGAGKQTTFFVFNKKIIPTNSLIDSTAPRININSPSPNAVFGANSPDYNVDISDTFLQKMWYTINDEGHYNFTSSTGTINQTAWDALSEGSVILTFYANDSSGNIGFDSVSIIKDTTDPIISIITPTTNQIFDSPPTFTLSITEDNLDQIWYTVDEGVNNITCSASDTLGSEWLSSSDGLVLLRFYVKDLAGHESSDTVTINKDTTDPMISITTPISEQIFHDPPSFFLDLTEPNIDQIWYTMDGGITNYNCSSSDTINSSAWGDLSEGSVTLTFYVNDTAGHFQSDSVIIEKNNYPIILINSPSDNDHFNDTAPNYNVDISDANLHEKWYTINDSSHYNITGTTGIINQTAWDVLSQGVVNISFYANDTFGSQSDNSVIIIKDSIPPSWIETPKTQFFQYLQNVSYDVNATDIIGIDNYWINDTTSNFSIDAVNGIIQNATILESGEYWLEVRAYDESGLYCNAIFKIIIHDHGIPEVLYSGLNHLQINPIDTNDYRVNFSFDLSGDTVATYYSSISNPSTVILDDNLLFIELFLNESNNLNELNITIEYMGIENLENLKGWWFNESLNAWEELSIIINGNYIIISVNHSSIFALTGIEVQTDVPSDDNGDVELPSDNIIIIIIIIIFIIGGVAVIAGGNVYIIHAKKKRKLADSKSDKLEEIPSELPLDPETVQYSKALEAQRKRKRLLQIRAPSNVVPKEKMELTAIPGATKKKT